MDMAHDIFLKLFLNIQKYSGKSKFKTWFYSFIYNFCINYVSREKSYFLEFDKIEEIEDLQEYDDEEIFKIEQISNVLGIGTSAVKMKILRAKSRLVGAYHKLEIHLENKPI